MREHPNAANRNEGETAMNATLTTERGRHNTREQHAGLRELPVRRVGLVDRVALHVGVALVKWGRRPLWAETHERRANRVEQHLAHLERQLAAERMRYLSAPQQ
jgi:hypothetical protein